MEDSETIFVLLFIGALEISFVIGGLALVVLLCRWLTPFPLL